MDLVRGLTWAWSEACHGLSQKPDIGLVRVLTKPAKPKSLGENLIPGEERRIHVRGIVLKKLLKKTILFHIP
jgi:hypothetical protein